jgi:hypothetical protein
MDQAHLKEFRGEEMLMVEPRRLPWLRQDDKKKFDLFASTRQPWTALEFIILKHFDSMVGDIMPRAWLVGHSPQGKITKHARKSLLIQATRPCWKASWATKR